MAAAGAPHLVALVLAAAQAAAAAPSRYPATHYEIEARIAPDLSSIDGSATIELTNDTGATTSAVTLLLFGNTFAAPLPGLTEVNRPFYEPYGPGLASSSVAELSIEGQPVEAVPLALAGAPPGTALLVRLPAPLLPLASTTLRLRFRTGIPERLGPFGRARGVLTALGGFYPVALAGDSSRRGLTGRRPAAADHSLRLSAPAGHRLLVGGAEPDEDGRVLLSRREWVELLVRPAAVRPLRGRGGRVWPLTSPPPDSTGGEGGLPDPPPLGGEWLADEIGLRLGRLDAWADAQPGLPDPGPAELVIVPLRSELALATGGIVAVSDRAYGVVPLAAAQQFHDRALARAFLSARVLPLVRARERPEDVPTVADALGAHLAERFITDTGDGSDLTGLLGALDFIPEIDAFLRSPKAAFSHVYFLPVQDPIPVRDEPWTFANRAPRGKLVLEKLTDLLGAPAVVRAVRDYLSPRDPCVAPAPGPGPAPCGLRAALEAVAGRDLGAYWEAWTERTYAEDLRIGLLSSVPVPDGFEAQIELSRVGEAPPEVIEADVGDADGRGYTLRWRARSGEARTVLTLTTKAPVTTLRIDPRGRVAQTAADPGEVPALGDALPQRLQLLVTRAVVSWSASDNLLYGDLDVTLRPRDEVRNRLSFGTSYRKARVGARASLGFGFGELIDATRYSRGFALGLTGDYLRGGFAGSATRAGWAVGPALGIGYDDRPSVPSPNHGLAYSASLSGSLGDSQDQGSSFYSGASAGVLQLLPLGDGALALRAKGAAIAGTPPIQELIPLGGSDDGLRGFTLEEVLGGRRILASVEWRHPFVTELDHDFGFGRLHGISGAVFVEGAAMGKLYPLTPDTPAEALFADFGYGLRLHYDAFGVRPLIFGADAGVPIGRLPAGEGRMPVTFSLRAGQAFGGP